VTITVKDLLEHPALVPAAPVVVAGAESLDRQVRWIHSSEVLTIAPLLRGGEVLLSGGELLGTVSPAEQRIYVRRLAERRVTALALETGPSLPVIPDALLAEANELSFPVLHLRQVVPFVSVTEAVNAELVNESVSRLRMNGKIAHVLSDLLGSGAEVGEMLYALTARLAMTVALVDSSGHEIGRVNAAREMEPATIEPHPVTLSVTIRGVHRASLVFYPVTDAGVELVSAIGDRAVEAIGLALLRTGPQSPRDLAGSELASLAARTDLPPTRLAELGRVVGFCVDDPVIGIMTRGTFNWGPPGLEGALAPLRRFALSSSAFEAHLVVSIPDRSHAARQRNELIDRIRVWAAQADELLVSVGPVVPTLLTVGATMRAAAACLARRTTLGDVTVLDAAVTQVTDWLSCDHLRDDAQQLVTGQLAMLFAAGPNEGSILLDTLEAYLDSGCSKTRTAAFLHLTRQSLYSRLDRIFAILGSDPTGMDRALGLHLALKLRHNLQLS